MKHCDRSTAALAVVAAMALGLALATAGPAAASTLAKSAAALDFAVDELQRCCDGDLQAVDWNQRRRWAYGLYRFVVLSDGEPDWTLIEHRDDLATQSRDLSPTWVATVAVRNRRWLEANGDSLTPRPGASDLDRLAASVYLIGAFVQEAETAELEYLRRQAALRREQAERQREIETALASAVDLTEQGDSYEEAVAHEAARLDAVVAERQKLIDDMREEFWRWRDEWIKRTADLTMGSVPHRIALTEYEDRANSSNDRILEITDEITRLTSRRDRLDRATRKASLTEIEVPAAARPAVLSRPR